MSDAGDGPGVEPGTNSVSQLDRVKQEYTAAAREILKTWKPRMTREEYLAFQRGISRTERYEA